MFLRYLLFTSILLISVCVCEQQTPKNATVELLITTDQYVFKHMRSYLNNTNSQKKIARITKDILHRTINSVQHIFDASFNDQELRVNFQINGFRLASNKNNYHSSSELLNKTRKSESISWDLIEAGLKQLSRGIHYDIALVIVGNHDNNNQLVSGRGYSVGTGCGGMAVVYHIDARVMAHVLAQTLGALHDNGYHDRKCPEGFLMDRGIFKKFSNCTVDKIKERMLGKKCRMEKCFFENNGPAAHSSKRVNLKKLPNFYSMAEQYRFYNPECDSPCPQDMRNGTPIGCAATCCLLYKSRDFTNLHVYGFIPFDGTPCGNGVCLLDKCASKADYNAHYDKGTNYFLEGKGEPPSADYYIKELYFDSQKYGDEYRHIKPGTVKIWEICTNVTNFCKNSGSCETEYNQESKCYCRGLWVGERCETPRVQ